MDLDYQTFFCELNRQNIDYLVVGGLAVNFHGIPRMTYDIDIMILLESQNIRKLVDTLLDWGYQAKAPVDPSDHYPPFRYQCFLHPSLSLDLARHDLF